MTPVMMMTKLPILPCARGRARGAAPYCTKCTVRGVVSLTRPLAEKYWYPKKVFDPTYMFVKLQLSSSNSFGDKRESQMYIGVLHPLQASWRKKCHTRNKYLTLPKRLWHFNFLSLLISEIWGGPKNTGRVLCPLHGYTPLAEKIYIRKVYLTLCKCA